MLLDLIQSGFDRSLLIQVLLSLPMIILALCVHETAHGWVAYKLGDPTARNLGRLSLNPLKHLDLLGFLAMMTIGIGWAKPVPINARNFSNPRVGMALSGIAGPISNLLMGFICILLYAVTWTVTVIVGDSPAVGMLEIVQMLFFVGAVINFSLAIFNLIPVPPFDGSRFIYIFLPTKWYFKVMKYERYTGLVLIGILLVLSHFGINPISIVVQFLIDLILSALQVPIYFLLTAILG